MDFLKELNSAWSQRIRSPLVGSILTAFVALNWQPIWYLFFADKPVRQKFLYFDANTDQATLIWFPILLGVTVALALPWATLVGAFAVKKPIKLLKTLQHDEATAQKIYQLETSTKEIAVRARLDAASEQAKIDAAKRLDEAKKVGGEELKEELEDDRTDNRQNDEDLADLPVSKSAIKTLKILANDPSGTFELVSSNNRYQLNIGLTTLKIDNRKDYLAIRNDIDELREHGLVERKQNAISDLGYKFLDRLGNPDTR